METVSNIWRGRKIQKENGTSRKLPNTKPNSCISTIKVAVNS
jgi:hypothetical protein